MSSPARWEQVFEFYDYIILPLDVDRRRASAWLWAVGCGGSLQGPPGYTTGYMLLSSGGNMQFATCFEYTGDEDELDFHFWVAPEAYRAAARDVYGTTRLREVMSLCCVYTGVVPAKRVVARIPHEERQLVRLALRCGFDYAVEQAVDHCIFTKSLHSLPFGVLNYRVDRRFEAEFFTKLLDKVAWMM